MHARDSSVRTTEDLIRRAAATSLNSARIIARSIELISRRLTGARQAGRDYASVSITRSHMLRTGTWPARRATRPRVFVYLDRVAPLLLTPPKLLELADEFRHLAGAAPSPASRAAFEDLAFRYIALAAGYDADRIGSRRLH